MKLSDNTEKLLGIGQKCRLQRYFRQKTVFVCPKVEKVPNIILNVKIPGRVAAGDLSVHMWITFVRRS